MEQFSERVQYKVPKSSVTSLSRAFTVLEEGKLFQSARIDRTKYHKFLKIWMP